MNDPGGRYHERIVSHPRILGGKPIIKGTRIAVDLVLEELATIRTSKSCWRRIRT
jgi:uncharacterized protein (DUF433 family)